MIRFFWYNPENISANVNSWLYLDELVIDETVISSDSEVLHYDFTDNTNSWTFQ